MQFEITAKVKLILPSQELRGRSGSVIVKNGFVLEWQDNGYDQFLCLEVIGAEKWEKMKSSVVEGNEVLCRFSLSSREYNGRWFTSASCFYCSSVGQRQQPQQSPAAAPSPAPQASDEALPF